MDKIKLSKKALKSIKVLPKHIKDKFIKFAQTVETIGYLEAISNRSYKDEALVGTRKNQRSIRLNKAYRVIYKLELEEIYIINILEINKHDY